MMILQQTRGALSSGDQLALDLPFAETKSLAARIGPTPVFTRASTGRFVGSDGLVQTAAVNTARFDHDPLNPSVCRGLLMEESRTNLTIQSEDFSSASWNPASLRNLTVTANNIASPSGATDADKLTVGSTTTIYQVLQNTATLTSGTAYSISCFFKAGEITRVNLYTGSFLTLPIDAIFDLTGSGSVVVATRGTASIQSFGNGWYRCIVTGTAGANSGTSLRISPISGTSQNYPGNGVDSFYAWGAQLEAGSFPTSYIPTTTSALARSADVCSITAPNFATFYNQPEGTLFADVTPQTVAQIVSVLTVNTTTFNQSHTIFKGDAIYNATGRRWGASTNLTGISVQSMIATSTDVATTRSRLAYAYKLNDFAFAASGSLVGTDTSETMPSPTTMHIGSREGSLQINGHLAAVRYYRLRLSNAKLQSLTA